jgi:hypothetical protein
VRGNVASWAVEVIDPQAYAVDETGFRQEDRPWRPHAPGVRVRGGIAVIPVRWRR